MKRLQNVIVDGTTLKSNFFNLVNNSDKPSYVYIWKKQNYEKLYFVRTEIELPYVDLYELRAQHRTGSLCGYAFDLYCKTPIVNTNFILSTNNIATINLKELKQNNNLFSLNHKLKGCNVYVLPNLATMLTISTNAEMKELLDL